MTHPRTVSTRDASRDGSVARLAELVRSDAPAILAAWKKRIERLPVSTAPSLSAHGAHVIEWVASSLAEHARHEAVSDELPGDASFSAARAIAELALLTESIGQLQSASFDHVARDALHHVIDAAIAHSLARDIDESDRLRKRLRLATDVTLVGSWELEPGTKLVLTDPRSCELFGIGAAAPMTVDALTSHVHPEDRARVKDGIVRALGSGAPYLDDCRTLRSDGSYRWIAIAADAHQGHTASPTLLGIVHDVSEQKRAEEEHARVIEELSRAVHISEMFVGILSHDLRNPLNAILAGAQLLARESRDEKSARILARVASSGERMGRMIEQLLDFTRARLGEGIPLGREAIDLAPLVREVVEEGKASSPSAVLRLSERGDTTGSWDRDRVSQVVSNLVGNALQHGQAAGAIDVVLDGSDRAQVELTVENNGSIAADLLPIIFNPFRGTAHRLGNSKGLGLGLYVARQIALAHGGELEVETTTRGTVTFKLRLPRFAAGLRPSIEKLAGDEELAAFERMAAPLSASAVTARLFGATPLHERVPREHGEIVERYGALLDSALHRRAYRGQGESLTEDLRALAERLGELGAGPREVTAVHAQALRRAVRGVTAAKTAALLSEGRLLALELMGNLAGYYRRRYRGQVQGGGSGNADA